MRHFDNIREQYAEETLFKFSDEAKANLTKVYKQHRSSLRAEEKDDIKAILKGRNQHIRKSAMLFASLDPETSNPVVTLKHLGFAIEWADYVLQCQTHILSNFSEDKFDMNEKKLIKWLAGRGSQEARSIYRGMGVSSKACMEALTPLVSMGRVEVETKQASSGGNKKEIRHFRVVE